MARYTADSKERVRDAVDMVDLVSARTELRRAGPSSYQGLCPFHEERTPSFGIDPVKKVYHCFGCGAGGDVFRFVQEVEGLDFSGALETLADRYGVELELESEDPRAAARRQRRERLYVLLDRTAGFYARYLWEGGEAQDARAYLAGRGLEEDVLRRFRVGYAPKPWDRMYRQWRSAGYSDEELHAAGLVKESQRGGPPYDRFRGRLTFPLCDQRGRVLGFGARALRPDQRPKYLNSAEGEVYHKGRQLFGADQARADAAKAGVVVLVEGYTDVLAMHQAGLGNVVGLMGTALTEAQLEELARLAPVVALALDADASGQEAMVRAARLAAGRSLELRVVSMPPGTDPAELVAAEGADAMRARVESAIPFARFRVELVLGRAPETIEGRTAAFEELRAVIGAMPPSPEREELRRMAADRLDLPADLTELLAVAPPLPADGPGRGAPAEPPGSPSAGAPPRAGAARASLDRREEIERTFLAMCIALPDVGRDALRKVDLDAHFTGPAVRRAAAHLRERLSAPTDGIPDDDGELASLMAELTLRAAREPADPAALELQTLQLETARLERAIASARAEGRPVVELAAEKQTVRERMNRAMAER
jgi:DNA primase